MNGSLVPANTKKSILFLGFLRIFPDLVILGVGTLATVLLLLIAGDSNTLMLLLFCAPMLISALLVMPIPNYHNTLCAIQSIIGFYKGRRNFIWKGWCTINEYKEDK